MEMIKIILDANAYEGMNILTQIQKIFNLSNFNFSISFVEKFFKNI